MAPDGFGAATWACCCGLKDAPTLLKAHRDRSASVQGAGSDGSAVLLLGRAGCLLAAYECSTSSDGQDSAVTCGHPKMPDDLAMTAGAARAKARGVAVLVQQEPPARNQRGIVTLQAAALTTACDDRRNAALAFGGRRGAAAVVSGAPGM